MSLCNPGTSEVPKQEPAARNQGADPFLNLDETLCEYRDDIWETLLQQESEKPSIHLQSPQLKFRGTLVLLLRNVSKKLKLSIGTLHSAVYYLDSFMDSHRLREDRMMYVALACLSLANKTEEQCWSKHIKKLSEASGTTLCPSTFKQMEWMIGQHLNWRLLAPTPVTFASLLAQYVVSDQDPTSSNPMFLKKFKRDGARILEEYLDLSLSNYRITLENSGNVACACVACTRSDLRLSSWPTWLAAATNREWSHLSSLTRLLKGMMRVRKCAELKTQNTGMKRISEISATVIPESVSERIIAASHHAYESMPTDPLLASTSVSVKRHSELPIEVDMKRCRLSYKRQVETNQLTGSGVS